MKFQKVKCESCGDTIEREQGEERICLSCLVAEEDGRIINGECEDR